MHALTGREFQNMVLGSGLRMVHVYKRAKVSSCTIHNWVNSGGDIYLNGTYNKLIKAYEELMQERKNDR